LAIRLGRQSGLECGERSVEVLPVRPSILPGLRMLDRSIKLRARFWTELFPPPCRGPLLAILLEQRSPEVFPCASVVPRRIARRLHPGPLRCDDAAYGVEARRGVHLPKQVC